jgi:hypothetical protein
LLSNLRAIRQRGIKSLTDFFRRFPDYDFSSILDKVFDLAVVPQVSVRIGVLHDSAIFRNHYEPIKLEFKLFTDS